ncbi:MAG TPA: hypothetical protein VMD91_10890 [Candidatus Sulfotelmatobacter sp.]|nr:hypothetical protein [Candidatus Sulfotelmatobacter sp.]
MKRILSAAALAAMLAGCGGGGGHAIPSSGGGSPGSPGSGIPIPTSNGRSTVTANATINTANLPALYNKNATAKQRTSVRRLKASGTQIVSVQINGTLYQGSASAIPVTNTQTVPLQSNGTVAVSETFSNVVPANNDWVVFEFYAIANDGSKSAIGSLATFVNVGSGSATTNLSTASTQVVEVAASLLSIGALSTYDIENDTTLASDLATKIAAQNVAVDSQTQLYDPTALLTLTENLATAYERDVTVSASGAQEFSITYDSTQKDENDLAYNALSFAVLYGLDVTFTGSPGLNSGGLGAYSTTSIIGAPETTGCTEFSCGLQTGQLPFSGPSAGYGDAQPTIVTAGIFDAASGTVTLRNVYGGHIIIGAHNGVAGGNYNTSIMRKAAFSRRASAAATTRHGQGVRRPQSPPTTPDYEGATISISGEAPGASTQALTLASTAANVSIVDAQAADFGQAPGRYENYGYFGFSPLPGANAAGAVPEYEIDCVEDCVTSGVINDGTFSEQQVYLSPPSDPTSDVITMTFDSWNAFAIPVSQIDVCSPSNCAPASTPTTTSINVGGAFDDPGNAIGVYDWQPGATGATQSIVQDPSPCCGGDYTVTYNIPANNTSAVSGSLTGTVSSTATAAAPFPITAYVPARATFYFTSQLPQDAIVTVTFTGTNGQTYTENLVPDGWSASTSIAAPFDVASWVLNYTLPADDVGNAGNPATTGTFNIYQFYVGGYYSLSEDCC